MRKKIKWIFYRYPNLGQNAFGILFSVIIFTLTVLSARADDSTHAQVSSKFLGKPLSVSQGTDVTTGELGVQSTTSLQLLGKTKTLSLFSILGNVNIPTANWYINGTKILSGNFSEQNGAFSFNENIAPGEIQMPIFSYAFGPVVLEVVSGVSYQGGITSTLQPISTSTPALIGDMNMNLSADVFVQGDGRFLLFAAGIGGQITAFDGQVGTNMNVTLDQILDASKTELTGSGSVSFLSGSVYGFLDNDKKNLFSWPGKCYSFDGSTPCAQ